MQESNTTHKHITPKQATYQIFILILTVFSLALIVLMLLPIISEETRIALQHVDFVICIIFLFDFFTNLRRAPSKTGYFFRQGGWLDLAGSIPAIPGLPLTALLRLARLGRLARIIRFLRNEDPKAIWHEFIANRAQSALLVTIFIAVAMITVSSLVVLQAETTRGTDPNIVTGGDAFWWAFVTITTVGYGDTYPTTGLGRTMALMLMVVGVGIFGVLTSYLSNAFIGDSDDEDEPEENKLDTMNQELLELKAELKAIRSILEHQESGAS